ncbi:MAG: DUF2007 domain-containing protein [Ignavibacteriales bacterium]|nr:DUF2007 domain-containing protein [Ignavibacteriales bacterium]
MFECPECGALFDSGAPVCPECGVVVDNPPDGSVSFYTDEFLLVYSCYDLYEAEMIKANLESGGIKTWIVNKKDSSYPGLGNMSAILIFVKVEDSESAFEFLKEYNESKKADIEEDPDSEEAFN